jgi:hypothetical protein
MFSILMTIMQLLFTCLYNANDELMMFHSQLFIALVEDTSLFYSNTIWIEGKSSDIANDIIRTT